MTFRISSHAVDRYIERVRTRATRDEAIRELYALCLRARYLRLHGTDGAELWRVSGSGRKPGDRVRMIVERSGDDAIVRSVLPAYEHGRPDR